MSLAGELAVRYFRRRSSRLVSRVSALAIAGVALGVMALVIAMGLLSGYRDEIQAKLVGANADVVVFPLAGSGIEHPEAVEAKLRRVPRVRAVSSVIYWQGTAASEAHPDGTNAVVKGVDPERERSVAPVGRLLEAGKGLFSPGPGGMPACAIGADLADRLGVTEGETIVLTVPDASAAETCSPAPPGFPDPEGVPHEFLRVRLGMGLRRPGGGAGPRPVRRARQRRRGEARFDRPDVRGDRRDSRSAGGGFQRDRLAGVE
jgi:ABC-type lipoprotein release transport system permease subunit